ncbi:MAG: metallophosphoesterase family protein [Candidatus Bipolaricaulota bacterium]
MSATRVPIAVLADVHGNARALDAVLREIERRGIRTIANLGDALYGPFDPRPVADRLPSIAVVSVSGNEDRVLVEAAAGRPASRTARFTCDRLAPAHVQWLASLPQRASLDGITLFHGAPHDDTVYLLSRVADGRLAPRPGAEVDALLAGVETRVVVCGHDHTPAAVETPCGVLVVNPGSVGCPAYVDDVPEPHAVENASPDARFAVLWPTSQGWTTELVAVAYDARAAAAEARANGFPDWATWLETGRATS